MFTDGTYIMLSSNEIEKNEGANQDLENISTWLRAYELTLNRKKRIYNHGSN